MSRGIGGESFCFYYLNFLKENLIDLKLFVGCLAGLILTSCSTLRDSLILGAGTGAAVGGIAGSQFQGDHGENALKGAVLGGVVGGIASYLIHGSLEARDSRVRKETLLGLEKYDVMGRESLSSGGDESARKSDKCFTTREVDGRLVSIPCRYVDDPNDNGSAR